jgi:phosphohistidine phosphatase
MTASKQLLLFRHAKSSWPEGVEDHERPLAPRGIKTAPKMAAFMAAEGLRPDLVLVSGAQRTRETWALMAPYLNDCEICYETRLYEASRETILDLIRGLDDDFRSVMLVGHNPGLHDAALALMKRETSEAEARLKQKFPTATLAVLSLDKESWADLLPASAHLEKFVTPQML